ncbi:formylglycine-generating enzyme family protein [bacterium]|nr:formylglycine-generating enzyme family protein [bacterium]
MNNRSLFLLLLSLAAATSVLANSTLTSVTASQRWPWNGKVDIDYTLTSNATFPVFRTAFHGQIEDGSVFDLSSIEGEGACGIVFGDGVKRITWNSTVDKPNTNTDDAKFNVIALDVSGTASTYLKLDLADYTLSPSATGPANVGHNNACKTTNIWFRRINQGTFYMGSASDEPNRQPGGIPEDKHQVTITRPIYIGVLETTADQYSRIMNIQTGRNSKLPRVQIQEKELRGETYGMTWPDKTDYRVDEGSFFGTLRQKTGHGLIFDLPTEAEWEMAARDKGDGTYAANGDYNCDGTYHGDYVWNDGVAFYDPQTQIADWSHTTNVAWNADQTPPNGITHEVGLLTPGLNGLYDMHGNAWDYCLDRLSKNLGTKAVTDPVGNYSKKANFCCKGGGIYKTDTPAHCRMAMRMSKDAKNDNCGFRIAIHY